MIAVFTSLDGGGIFQFANQIATILQELGKEYKLFVPCGTRRNCNPAVIENTYEYQINKTILPFEKTVKVFAQHINELSPELFIAVDDAIRSELVVLNLNKKIKTCMVVHDVTPHLRHLNIRKYLVEAIRQSYRTVVFTKLSFIILLSTNSINRFTKIYSRFGNKVRYLPLGAHIMPAEESIPPEMSSHMCKKYILFFGRIDQYKGVDRLMRVHTCCCTKDDYDLHLVIAGQNVTGEMLKTESNSITLIQRFITDGEMLWLFNHCKAVVLPYLEASQSGVLPIAYKLGIPVLTSNIEGLRELVDVGVTGYTFDSDCDFENILLTYSTIPDSCICHDQIRSYYKENLDWATNVIRLLGEVEANEGIH